MSDFTTGKLVSKAVAPEVHEISEHYLKVGGGETITLTGVNFEENMQFFIGGEVAEVISITSTSVILKTPLNFGGAAGLKIVDLNGQSYIHNLAFVYIENLEISFLNPGIGFLDGNDYVEIVGKGFRPDMTATIGGNHVEELQVLSPSRLRCFSPAGTFGLADVVLTTPDGQVAALEKGFLYSRLKVDYLLATKSGYDAADVTRLSHGIAKGMNFFNGKLYLTTESRRINSGADSVEALQEKSYLSTLSVVAVPEGEIDLDNNVSVSPAVDLSLPLLASDLDIAHVNGTDYAVVMAGSKILENLGHIIPDQPGIIMVDISKETPDIFDVSEGTRRTVITTTGIVTGVVFVFLRTSFTLNSLNVH